MLINSLVVDKGNFILKSCLEWLKAPYSSIVVLNSGYVFGCLTASADFNFDLVKCSGVITTEGLR